MTRWRTGTKNPHALYLDDEPVGFILDPELAQAIVERLECFPTVEIPGSPEPIDPMSMCGVSEMHTTRIVPTDPAKAPQARQLEHYLNTEADRALMALQRRQGQTLRDMADAQAKATGRRPTAADQLVFMEQGRSWPAGTHPPPEHCPVCKQYPCLGIRGPLMCSRADAPSEAEKLSARCRSCNRESWQEHEPGCPR